MAALSAEKIAPLRRISKRAVPDPLCDAIVRIFANCGEGIWLVGGTALAGFYTEHRRSDDIDLFARDDDSHQRAVLSIKGLAAIGAVFSNQSRTPQYYRADILLSGHAFTADAVLDENIHRIGRAVRTDDGVCVADIRTLMAMKIACLVSRVSEKDLFDLDWMFRHIGQPGIEEMVAMGSEIDGGLSVETLLISLKGSMLKKEACRFLLPGSPLSPEGAYRRITALRARLVKSLLEHEKTTASSPETEALAGAVHEIRNLRSKTPSRGRPRRRRP